MNARDTKTDNERRLGVNPSRERGVEQRSRHASDETMLRKQQFSAARIIAVIIIMSIASSIVLAANNPGHDTLYILKVGDNMTGSLNLTGNLTAYGIQTATFLYGSGLDIWANGSTQQAVSSKPTIQAAGTNLFIDNPLAGDLRFNTIAGTSNLVRFGTGAIGVIVNGTLNVVNHTYVNGTIRIYSNGSGSFADGTTVGGNPVCTSTNGLCSGGATGFTQWRLGSNTGTIAAITNNTLVNITGGTTITTTLSGSTITLAVPTGGIGVAQIAAAVNTSYDNRYVARGTWTTIDNYPTGCSAGEAVQVIGDTLTCIAVGGGGITGTGAAGNFTYWHNGSQLNSSNMYYRSGKVGIGTTAPSQKLDVNGSVNIGGNITMPSGVMISYDGTAYTDHMVGIAIGDGAVATRDSVAIGGSANVGGYRYSVALGSSSRVNADYQVAIGNPAEEKTLYLHGDMMLNGTTSTMAQATCNPGALSCSGATLTIQAGNASYVSGPLTKGGNLYLQTGANGGLATSQVVIQADQATNSTATILHIGNGGTGNIYLGGTTSNSRIYDAAGDLTLDSDTAQVIIAEDLRINGNDILDSGGARRITLGATGIYNGSFTVNGSAARFTVNSSASTGSVVFGNTTGSTHFFIEGNTGEIGIGTTAPQYILDVNSSANTQVVFSGVSPALLLLNNSRGEMGGVGGAGVAGAYSANALKDDVVLRSNRGQVILANNGTLGYPARLVIDTNGNVGIGTPTPTYRLDVASTVSGASAGANVAGFSSSLNRAYAGGSAGGIVGGMFLTLTDSTGPSALSSQAARIAFNRNNNNISSAYDVGVVSFASINNGNGGSFYDFMANGVIVASNINISTRIGLYATESSGAGTLTSQYGVYVDALTKGASNYAIYTAGTTPSYFGGRVLIGPGTPGNATGAGDLYVQSDIELDGTFYGSGSDVAEMIDAIGTLTPGTVVELHPAMNTTVRMSTKAYSKTVAGIITTRPSLLLGTENNGAALAISGRVPVKANNENGPIKVGDLLTTSSTPGEAMKCDDPTACFGAILGKAAEDLTTNHGIITALVMLG